MGQHFTLALNFSLHTITELTKKSESFACQLVGINKRDSHTKNERKWLGVKIGHDLEMKSDLVAFPFEAKKAILFS